MKIPVSSRRRGFTLVELLVVITIIAVLAAAGFAAGNAAVQKAKKVKALASCTALSSAVENFYTEYGRMPYDGGTADVTVSTDSGEGITLLEALLGLDEKLNPRGVKFLSVKEGKGKRDGIVYSANGNSVEGLFDPWGGPYNVIMDLDYDEQVRPEPSAGGARNLNGRRVAVWTDGADNAPGSGNRNKPADDVKTW